MDSILQKTGKKLFEKHLEKYAAEDPLYEYYADDKGREKRRKVCYSTAHAYCAH